VAGISSRRRSGISTAASQFATLSIGDSNDEDNRYTHQRCRRQSRYSGQPDDGAKHDYGRCQRVGISGVTRDQVQSAAAENQRWKLIGTLENVNGEIQGSVKPVKLDETHPLYGIGGATNAITYSTDLLGDITLIGPGAGRMETGFAIIADILSFSNLR
jgi:hypothetical protein